jgi:hypothetical protein
MMTQTILGQQLVTKQLHILQGLLADVRFLIGEAIPQKELYDIVDRIEFLPSLIGTDDPADRELFRETIIGLNKWDIFAPQIESAKRLMS